ncbi:unnamed protein product [Vitrella brassicaformis CCMP3155]|uniref:A-kinase anchor protein 7-like phosphoesterase domain-containing protein n=1 Tax=Vitrella brassicaformis (strain CCMP3155) TaxID=1169540 RepID=A0A0G4ED82_VITBC|nr:unnamed protein product [Vitrella brassicaformis CCMP3155]|eukprot:CEL93953.1 unnamed protein product [Vitrella brassicaformis CCMP3155]
MGQLVSRLAAWRSPKHSLAAPRTHFLFLLRDWPTLSSSLTCGLYPEYLDIAMKQRALSEADASAVKKRKAVKRKPTHFVSVRVDAKEIVDKVEDLQQKIIAVSPDLEQCAIKPIKLHYSLVVLPLEKRDIPNALRAMEKGVECALEQLSLTEPLEVDVMKVATFGTRVLFGGVSDESLSVLTLLNQELTKAFESEGLLPTTKKGKGRRRQQQQEQQRQTQSNHDEEEEEEEEDEQDHPSDMAAVEVLPDEPELPPSSDSEGEEGPIIPLAAALAAAASSADAGQEDDTTMQHKDETVEQQEDNAGEDVEAAAMEAAGMPQAFRSKHEAQPQKGKKRKKQKGQPSQSSHPQSHKEWRVKRPAEEHATPEAPAPAASSSSLIQEDADARAANCDAQEQEPLHHADDDAGDVWARSGRRRERTKWGKKGDREKASRRRPSDRDEVEFTPHMTIFKTSQAAKKRQRGEKKGSRKSRQLSIDISNYTEIIPDMDLCFGKQVVTHVDLCSMMSLAPDGYYRSEGSATLLPPAMRS